MTAVELAERKARARALVYLVFAAIELLLLLATLSPRETDFLRGLWVGITVVAAMNMLPFGRWLRPNSMLTRLLDDEATREHRHVSGVAGFWAAMASGIALTFVTADNGPIAAFDVARVIVTAALVAALASFAVQELRAAT